MKGFSARLFRRHPVEDFPPHKHTHSFPLQKHSSFLPTWRRRRRILHFYFLVRANTCNDFTFFSELEIETTTQQLRAQPKSATDWYKLSFSKSLAPPPPVTVGGVKRRGRGLNGKIRFSQARMGKIVFIFPGFWPQPNPRAQIFKTWWRFCCFLPLLRLSQFYTSCHLRRQFDELFFAWKLDFWFVFCVILLF